MCLKIVWYVDHSKVHCDEKCNCIHIDIKMFLFLVKYYISKQKMYDRISGFFRPEKLYIDHGVLLFYRV